MINTTLIAHTTGNIQKINIYTLQSVLKSVFTTVRHNMTQDVIPNVQVDDGVPWDYGECWDTYSTQLLTNKDLRMQRNRKWKKVTAHAS